MRNGIRCLHSLSDLHLYLTVPFVLSWSLLNALACDCTVLASDTALVREAIEHEKNGPLAGFFDVETLATQALRVLKDPAAYRALAAAGQALVEERYSLDQTLPRLWRLFSQVSK
jgi:glycosyltransferase involved in cell wall biosynthesis